MKKIATLGYRGRNEIKKLYVEDVFRQCLLDAGVDLVVDIRYYNNGQFWSSHNIKSFIYDLDIDYLEDYHELLGVKNFPIDSDFLKYRSQYIKQLKKNSFVFLHINELIKKYSKVAILCCEPFIEGEINCHRFILAEALQKVKIVDGVEHLCMDKTYDKMLGYI